MPAPFIPTDARIFVAGHRGLAGSALVRKLRERGYANLILRNRAELDLADRAAVSQFFAQTRPEFVFLAAAKVGGILANDSYPADFISVNLDIQCNVIRAAHATGARRLLFLGSTCVYPRDCPQPMKEEYLLTGPLEPTNRAYAIAKIAGIEMCRSYNRQHGTRFLCPMPTNLYGPGDNYDLETSHVVAALIRRFHEAKMAGAPGVMVWGTGRPRREFMHADDMADACLFLANLPDDRFLPLVNGHEGGYSFPTINIGTGAEVTVAELAETIARVVGYVGRIEFDKSKPDGTPRKLVDLTRLEKLGWSASIQLSAGLESSYSDFLHQQECVDGSGLG